MSSTVTIPLSEYNLMQARLARKKDKLVSCYYNNYYGTLKQKQVLEACDNARKEAQEELRKIKDQFKKIEWSGADCKITQNEPLEIISKYKKSIRNLKIALGVSITTIIILLLI